MWKESNVNHLTRHISSRLSQVRSEDRFFKGFMDCVKWKWLLTDQMNGPVDGSKRAQSSTSIQTPARWRWSIGIGRYYLSWASWRRAQTQLQNLLPVFRRHFLQAVVQKNKSASFKRTIIFMQDNAPSHSSKYLCAASQWKPYKIKN